MMQETATISRENNRYMGLGIETFIYVNLIEVIYACASIILSPDAKHKFTCIGFSKSF